MKDNQKGMTLVEMIIVIAVIGLMLIPIYNVMSSNSVMMKKTEAMATAKNFAIDYTRYIEKELQYAQNVYVGNETSNFGNADAAASISHIRVVNNKLQKGTGSPIVWNDIYDSNYVGKYEIVMKAEAGVDTVTVQFDVKYPNVTTYTYGPISIDPLNVKISSGGADGNDGGGSVEGGSGNYISYYIP
ncbi:MAG: PilW family protein [Cellulosilyticaceae bacterium]